jgi:dihydroneopterin aldolase
MAEYQIELTDLTGFGFHGVLPEERKNGQEFSVDVTLIVKSSKVNDDLANTVNYAQIAKLVNDHIIGEPVALIETLADLIADEIFALPLVSAVEVTVHKPQAPIEVPFGNVSVTVVRGEV